MTQRAALLTRLWRILITAAMLLSVAQASAAEEPTVLRGQVLLPDGKPAPGAEIYWLQLKTTGEQSPREYTLQKRATADDEGRFRWTLADDDLHIGASGRPPLVAYKPGFGLDGLMVGREEADGALALRLAESCPIRGRLIDTEGRAVKGAKVVVASVEAANDGSLDRLLDKWKRSRQEMRGRPEQMVPLQRFTALDAETDDQGRFTISGLGKERVAVLNITASGYMTDELRVVTREAFDADAYNKSMTANVRPFMQALGWAPHFAGPAFDHIMEAELVIRGKVFTGPDRKPVAEARVGAGGGPGGGGQSIASMPMTDAAGRFEVRGVRRSENVGLTVYPRDDLLSRVIRLDAAPGQSVVEVDVEVKKGIVVEGRIFDPTTGEGVQGNVSYVPLPENRFVDEPGYDGAKNSQNFLTTGADGRFRYLVPPGPGVLMAQVQSNRPRLDGNQPKPYRQASFNEEDSKRVPTAGERRHFTKSGNSIVFLGLYGSVKVIDPAPESGPLTCDLPLDRGKTATISLEDDQNKPVSGAWVAGVADLWPITYKIAESSCTVYGLGADRPRRLCVFHPQRRLAASLTITGEEPKPVSVRLRAPATIIGRALDPDGAPLADAVVQVNYLGETASELLRFASMDVAPLKTDADGRFQVENVLPGERLALGFKQGDTGFYIDGLTTKDRQFESGQKLDLGDVKVKKPL